MTIKLGATLVVEHSFTYPAQIYRRMDREHITVFPAVPTIFSMMVATNRKKQLVFPSITRVTSTAAVLSASLIPELKQIFPNALIYKMYGQTECKRISYLDPNLLDAKPDSVGKAIPGTEIFILSPDGKKVKQGESGILHVRGTHIMAGYWKEREKTTRTLKKGSIPGERILCTHDWFHMDDEGLLYFEGRTDDIIKTKGEKVSPLEVENVLQAIPGIREAAVIGVQNKTFGQTVQAFIVTDETMTLKERQLKMICLAKMENYMVPQSITFLTEMPKNQNGKIDKKKLPHQETA
jgi:acyl-coenzyme A synthetase/AMP-(fatty) acid ligase